MEPPLTDRTGARVRIDVLREGPVSSYVVIVDDGAIAGRAEFVEAVASERIFFHTEVGEAYAGRGLAGLLVARALADSIRDQVTVVPICPFFARHLRDHGSDFTAGGGRYRRPTGADGAAVAHALESVSG